MYKTKRHIVYQPDKGQILSRFLETCTAKVLSITAKMGFNRESKIYYELFRITIQNRTDHSQVTVFQVKKMGQPLVLPHFIVSFN